jgi:hypothetical protein
MDPVIVLKDCVVLVMFVFPSIFRFFPTPRPPAVTIDPVVEIFYSVVS